VWAGAELAAQIVRSVCAATGNFNYQALVLLFTEGSDGGRRGV